MHTSRVVCHVTCVVLCCAVLCRSNITAEDKQRIQADPNIHKDAAAMQHFVDTSSLPSEVVSVPVSSHANCIHIIYHIHVHNRGVGALTNDQADGRKVATAAATAAKQGCLSGTRRHCVSHQ